MSFETEREVNGEGRRDAGVAHTIHIKRYGGHIGSHRGYDTSEFHLRLAAVAT